MSVRFSIKTLGCKLNQYETSLIAHQLKRMGWQVEPFGEKVDVVIVNTCTVTDRSDKKCRNYIRQAARLSRLGGAVVTGCLAERDAEGLRRMPEVLAVYGNGEKDLLHEKLRDLFPDSLSREAHDRENGGSEPSSLREQKSTDEGVVQPLPLYHTRGFIKIQDGCDGRCSYCVVPSVRGGPRSRDIEEVLLHARTLVESGCPELVLTGITIGKYISRGTDLAGLVRRMAALPGHFRIRITSIEPNHITQSLVELLGSEKVCRHIHIPSQSGSDRVLALMNRPYSASDLREIIDRIKKHDENIAIGSDIIVGFPGEEDADFARTLDLVNYAGFSYVHQFGFSSREGTPASAMEGRVFAECAVRRSAILRKTALVAGRAYRRRFEGMVLPAVMEYNRRVGEYTALSDNYIKIGIRNTPAARISEGTIVPVKLVSVEDGGCWGEIFG